MGGKAKEKKLRKVVISERTVADVGGSEKGGGLIDEGEKMVM